MYEPKGHRDRARGGAAGCSGFDGNPITETFFDKNTSGQSKAIGNNFGAKATPTNLSGWGTGAGLYPYLKNFFPDGIQVVSGFAMSDAGVTALASGDHLVARHRLCGQLIIGGRT